MACIAGESCIALCAAMSGLSSPRAWFLNLTGTQMVMVPYKGAAQAMPDLLSGQIQLMFVSVPEALPRGPASCTTPLVTGSPYRSVTCL